MIENEFGEVGVDDALVLNTTEEIFEVHARALARGARAPGAPPAAPRPRRPSAVPPPMPPPTPPPPLLRHRR